MTDRGSLDLADEGRFLADRLLAWTEQAVSGTPGSAVARAIAATHPRSSRPRWLPDVTLRPAWLTMVAAFLLAAALAVVALAPFGGRPLVHLTLPTATPGLGSGRPLLVIESGQIVAVSVDTGETRHFGAGSYARWSPDGSRISFVGPDGMGVMASDGSRRRTLSTDTNCQLGPWSPDSLTVLAACGPDGSEPRFQLFGATDDTVRPLGSLSAYKDSGSGSWSPDGSQIALPIGANSLGVATGSGSTTQTRYIVNCCSPWLVRWSPDGASIAYAAGGIYLVDSDGANKRRLVPGVLPCELRWAPDSLSLAFVAPTPECSYEQPAGTGDARVVDVDRGTMRSIPSPLAGQQVLDLAWSPDGRRLAIVVGTSLRCGSDPGYGSVWVVNADGSNPRQVVDAIDCEWPDLGGPDW
jgi:hypothetical protein